MKKFFALLVACLLSTSVYANSADEGVLKVLYTDNSGNMAVLLEGGFPNSIAANECSTSNGYAGVAATANASLKAALLAAKASQSPVALVISGCEAGGAWMKVVAVYVK